MRYWLFKTEPEVFSWDDLARRGADGEPWDGVRNHQARAAMEAMAAGDRGLLYHSGRERACIGVVEVVASAHPDPTDGTGRWSCVDIRAVEPLARPVTLAAIRGRPELADMALVRQSRLSVQPVEAEAWRAVLAMGAGEG